MREIKFRAWDKERKCFIGFYSEGLHMWENGQIYSGGMNVTSRIELMQYTGLHDKNGKEIYEGDVVKTFNGEIGKVSHGEYQNEDSLSMDEEFYMDTDEDERKDVGFHVEHKNGDCNSIDNMAYKWIEVVGNEFENPELLQGGDHT